MLDQINSLRAAGGDVIISFWWRQWYADRCFHHRRERIGECISIRDQPLRPYMDCQCDQEPAQRSAARHPHQCRARGRHLKVQVEDNGVGFDPEFAVVAFNPLARGIHTAGEGSGIGLSTCRNIIQSHGGEIRVDPAFRSGARIEFTLPAEPQPEPAH